MQQYANGWYATALPGDVPIVYMFGEKTIIVILPSIQFVMVDVMKQDIRNDPKLVAELTRKLNADLVARARNSLGFY